MGELEQPAPLWGAAQQSRTDASASGQARSDNGDPAQNPEGAVNRQSDRNRSIDPAPPRTLPIEGQGSDPFQVAPQGALPDPYANPQ